MAAAAVPLATYNTGYTSGMNSGTTYSAALSSGGGTPAAASVNAMGGSANVTVGVLVAAAIAVVVIFHLLGFRFAFDVSVGRG